MSKVVKGNIPTGMGVITNEFNYPKLLTTMFSSWELVIILKLNFSRNFLGVLRKIFRAVERFLTALVPKGFLLLLDISMKTLDMIIPHTKKSLKKK